VRRALLLLIAARLFATSEVARADDTTAKKPASRSKTKKKSKKEAPAEVEMQPDAPPEPVAAPIPVAITPPVVVETQGRAIVTPQHVLELHGVLPIVPSGGSVGLGLEVGGTYGVADKLELGGDYALSLKAFDATGTLTVRGAYLAKTSASWDLAVAAALIADLNSGGETSVNVGGWFRYHLGPRASLFTGTPGIPPLVAGAVGLPRPPSPYQLTFGVNNGNRVAINLPIGLGYQASPQVYVYASTTLAYLLFDATEQRLLFVDFIPIAAGLYYSTSPALDLGVQVADDLRNAGDSYAVLLTARYFVK
jgi:hypothetical protein